MKIFFLNALIFSFVFFFPSCNQRVKKTEARDLLENVQKETTVGFELAKLVINSEVYLEDGIYLEKKPEEAINFNYSYDNLIFVDGTEFKYSYVYLDKSDSLFVRIKKNRNLDGSIEMDWELSPIKDDSTITIVSITPEVFSDFFGNDYKQTIIRYDYFNLNNDIIIGNAKSGCIENYKNVWMHPPRDFLFKILQLNPFPFIQSPYEIGNKWNGELTIGKFWADERWKTWENPITNSFTYKIIDNEILKSEFGEIECLVISAKAKSNLGESALTSWFNSTYGFIRMEYHNIDSSKIHFTRVWNH